MSDENLRTQREIDADLYENWVASQKAERDVFAATLTRHAYGHRCPACDDARAAAASIQGGAR